VRWKDSNLISHCFAAWVQAAERLRQEQDELQQMAQVNLMQNSKRSTRLHAIYSARDRK
jgi:hypothetical protein